MLVCFPAGLLREQQPATSITEEDRLELQLNYLADEKENCYVGSKTYASQFPVGSRKYFNSLATFAHQQSNQLHGIIGQYKDGKSVFQTSPRPHPVTQVSAIKVSFF